MKKENGHSFYGSSCQDITHLQYFHRSVTIQHNHDDGGGQDAVVFVLSTSIFHSRVVEACSDAGGQRLRYLSCSKYHSWGWFGHVRWKQSI
jgi:hypothetical protein